MTFDDIFHVHGKMGKIRTLQKIHHKAQCIPFEGQSFILTLCLATLFGVSDAH